MSGDGLHDLFTVFTFKTPPSGDFVCGANKKEGELAEPAAAPRRSRPANFTFLELRAESNCQASLDGRLPSDTLEAIPQRNSRGDCCKSRRRFASARASKALL